MLILLIKSFLVIFVLVCLVLYFSIDIINLAISEKNSIFAMLNRNTNRL